MDELLLEISVMRVLISKGLPCECLREAVGETHSSRVVALRALVTYPQMLEALVT